MSDFKKVKQTNVKAADLIHGDESHGKMEVAPSVSVSTSKTFATMALNQSLRVLTRTVSGVAFRTPHPKENFTLDDFDPRNPSRHVYSRYTQDIGTRAEKILSKINVSCLVLELSVCSNLGYLLTTVTGWLRLDLFFGIDGDICSEYSQETN